MRNKEIEPKDRKMLDLLSRGLSNRAIAAKLGYKHGTTRVYLHALYRKLGVAGKTAAVVWYADHLKASAAREAAAALRVEEGVGDLALRTGLFAALGAMSLLLGPYGKVWQVAARLKGGADPAGEERRRQSRLLWEALLKADSPVAKKLVDRDAELQPFLEVPGDAVVLALLLCIGGHVAGATRISAHLGRARRGVTPASAREIQLVDAACEAAVAKDLAAVEAIHRIASGAPANTPGRHVAMAALFHAYRVRGDAERAKATAEALWAEAESARQHLLAMGENPLPREAALPVPKAVGAKDSAPRHKEALVSR